VAVTLSRWHLTGTLSSAALANLRYLATLDVSHNALTGPIPVDTLSRLAYLKFVDLSHNQFVTRTSQDQDDDHPAAGTSWTGTPFPNLLSLSLDSNFLSGSLSSLLELWQSPSRNRLAADDDDDDDDETSNPDADKEATTTTSTLQLLDVSNNLLTGTLSADALSAWPQLVGFWASHNVLTGTLPNISSSLTQLHTLDVYGNALSGSLRNFALWPASLRTLILSDNVLTGSLPSPHPRLPHLHALAVSYNALTGTIPVNDWSKLRQLGVLWLGHNRLTGTLPIAFMTGQAASLGLYVCSALLCILCVYAVQSVTTKLTLSYFFVHFRCRDSGVL
jgi:hypothetical protein